MAPKTLKPITFHVTTPKELADKIKALAAQEMRTARNMALVLWQEAINARDGAQK